MNVYEFPSATLTKLPSGDWGITTFAYGHFWVFPLVVGPSLSDGPRLPPNLWVEGQGVTFWGSQGRRCGAYGSLVGEVSPAARATGIPLEHFAAMLMEELPHDAP